MFRELHRMRSVAICVCHSITNMFINHIHLAGAPVPSTLPPAAAIAELRSRLSQMQAEMVEYAQQVQSRLFASLAPGSSSSLPHPHPAPHPYYLTLTARHPLYLILTAPHLLYLILTAPHPSYLTLPHPVETSVRNPSPHHVACRICSNKQGHYSRRSIAFPVCLNDSFR